MKKTFKLLAALALGAFWAASCSKPYQELSPAFSSLNEDLSVSISAGEKVDVPFTLKDIRGNKVEVSVNNENENYTVTAALASDYASGTVSIAAPSFIESEASFKVTLQFSEKTSGRVAESVLTVKPVFPANFVALTEPANCYVVAPGALVQFPTCKGNTSTKSGAEEVVLGWQDENGLFAGVVKVGDGNAVVSFAEGKEGNAVVLGKKGGAVVWSWHFWVANEAPKDVVVGSYTFQDRNVGATTLDEKSNNSIGVIFQYGRKDPFPCIKGYDSVSKTYVLKDEYNDKGEVLAIKIEDNKEANNLENTIKNPLTYYKNYFVSGQKHNFSWLTTDCTTLDINVFKGLWQNGGKKSMYDPCPAGYKIADKAAWEVVKAQTATEIWDNSYVTPDDSAIGTNETYAAGNRKKVQFRGCSYGGLKLTTTGEVNANTAANKFEFAFANCIGKPLPTAEVWIAEIDPSFESKVSATYFRGMNVMVNTSGNGKGDDLSAIKVNALSITSKYGLHYALPVRCVKE